MGSLLLIGFVLLIPLLLLVTIILLVTKKSAEPFSKKIDTIYTYLVLLIALVMIIVGVVLLITSLTDLLLPTNFSTDANDLNEHYVSIIGAIGIIIVSIPLFLGHQKRIRKK